MRSSPSGAYDVRALLDTCTLLWLVSDSARISQAASRAIDAADDLYLSDASIWELGLKWSAGKIGLPAPPRLWVPAQCSRWSISAVAITRNHLFRSFELPRVHRDPFDRLIVAQAIENGMTVITPDEAIHGYPVAALW